METKCSGYGSPSSDYLMELHEAYGHKVQQRYGSTRGRFKGEIGFQDMSVISHVVAADINMIYFFLTKTFKERQVGSSSR